MERLSQLRRRRASPAPGYRHASYGTSYAVGGNGYSWASSVTAGTYAYDLGFYYGGINSNGNYYRANGLPLRCLQE